MQRKNRKKSNPTLIDAERINAIIELQKERLALVVKYYSNYTLLAGIISFLIIQRQLGIFLTGYDSQKYMDIIDDSNRILSEFDNKEHELYQLAFNETYTKGMSIEQIRESIDQYIKPLHDTIDAIRYNCSRNKPEYEDLPTYDAMYNNMIRAAKACAESSQAYNIFSKNLSAFISTKNITTALDLLAGGWVYILSEFAMTRLVLPHSLSIEFNIQSPESLKNLKQEQAITRIESLQIQCKNLVKENEKANWILLGSSLSLLLLMYTTNNLFHERKDINWNITTIVIMGMILAHMRTMLFRTTANYTRSAVEIITNKSKKIEATKRIKKIKDKYTSILSNIDDSIDISASTSSSNLLNVSISCNKIYSKKDIAKIFKSMLPNSTIDTTNDLILDISKEDGTEDTDENNSLRSEIKRKLSTYKKTVSLINQLEQIFKAMGATQKEIVKNDDLNNMSVSFSFVIPEGYKDLATKIKELYPSNQVELVDNRITINGSTSANEAHLNDVLIILKDYRAKLSTPKGFDLGSIFKGSPRTSHHRQKSKDKNLIEKREELKSEGKASDTTQHTLFPTPKVKKAQAPVVTVVYKNQPNEEANKIIKLISKITNADIANKAGMLNYINNEGDTYTFECKQSSISTNDPNQLPKSTKEFFKTLASIIKEFTETECISFEENKLQINKKYIPEISEYEDEIANRFNELTEKTHIPFAKQEVAVDENPIHISLASAFQTIETSFRQIANHSKRKKDLLSYLPHINETNYDTLTDKQRFAAFIPPAIIVLTALARLCNTGMSDAKKIFYALRNILRHGAHRLNWAQIQKLYLPLFKCMAEYFSLFNQQPTNHHDLKEKMEKIRNVLSPLLEHISSFKELENGSLCLSQEYINNEIQDMQNLIASQQPISMADFLSYILIVGEPQNADQFSKSIYIEVGHHMYLSKPYPELLQEVYNRYVLLVSSNFTMTDHYQRSGYYS